MNTFLPYKNFRKCAKVLDDKRLFKQAVEAMQILDILTTGMTNSGKEYPLCMKHHPIVKAWSKNEDTLFFYYNCMVGEVYKRGKYKTSLMPYDFGILKPKTFVLPDWLTDDVCLMYQAHLMRKDSTYYKFDTDPTTPFDWSKIRL